MKNQKHEPKNKKSERIIFQSSEVHDFLWERNQQRANRRAKQTRTVDQYSADYLEETLRLQARGLVFH